MRVGVGEGAEGRDGEDMGLQEAAGEWTDGKGEEEAENGTEDGEREITE